MRTFVTTAAILGLALAPAMAQTSATHPAGTAATSGMSNTTTSGSAGTSAAPMAPGAMQEALKRDLSQAGFTDIQVMPSSFLVRAKDKAGHPIMMVINPDSVTEIATVGKPTTPSK